MLHDWGVIGAAFAYIGFLFFVASYGDRLSPTQRGRASALIYPLSLAIYCTSWTFFGSVGFASRTSVDFLAIYVGPILMVGLCTPLLRRVIQLAKAPNITPIAESIVKLVAFLAVGMFVTFWMFSPHELIERAMKTPEAVRALSYTPSIGNFLTMTLLSFCAIMLLPRQFHVSVVENSTDAEVGRARWLFPLYLVLINLFVIPISISVLVTFPCGAVESV